MTKILFSYTPTNFNHLGLVITDQAFRSALRLGILLAIARLCSKTDFAFYTIIQASYIYMLHFCTSFLLGPYIVFCHEKNFYNKGEYNTILLIFFVVALFVMSLIYVIIFKTLNVFIYKNATYLFASLFFMIGDLINVFVRMLFVGKLKYGTPLISGILSTLLFVLLFILHFNDISVVKVMLIGGLAYILPSLVICYIGTDWSFRSIEVPRIRQTLKKHFGFGKWIFINNYINILTFSTFPFFLAFFQMNDILSEYGAYYNFFAIFNPAFLILNNFLSPRFAQSYQEGSNIFSNKVWKAIAATSIVSIFFLIIVTTTGKGIYHLLYGSTYMVTISTLTIWAISKCLELNMNVFVAAIKATQKTYNVFLSSLSSFFIFLAIGLPLVYYYGIPGVALSLIMTRFVGIACASALLIKTEKMVIC